MLAGEDFMMPPSLFSSSHLKKLVLIYGYKWHYINAYVSWTFFKPDKLVSSTARVKLKLKHSFFSYWAFLQTSTNTFYK